MKYSISLLTRNTLLMFLILVTSVSCTIRLISNYDEQTDEAVTALQRKLSTFFVELESTAGTDAAHIDNHIDFYKEVDVDISAIALRVAALPKNEITQQQIKLLRDNLAKLKEIHQIGISSVELVSVIREDFDQALASILRLELAKKR